MIPSITMTKRRAPEIDGLRWLVAGSFLLASLSVSSVSLAEEAAPEEAAEPDEAAEGEEEGEPEGHHCADGGSSKWVWHQLLVGQYAPWGLEHTGRVGYCTPFIRNPGALWSHTHLEVGVAEYLSPAYGTLGAYVQLAPISLLVLRVELTYMAYWPFPMNRAGYFPREDYNDTTRPEDLPYEMAESGDGFNLNFVAVLRAKVDLGRVALVVLNALTLSFWQMGDADYYVQPRYELVFSNADWGLNNELFLMLEIPLPRNIGLRVGVYDSLRYGVGSGQLNNNVGLVVMPNWPALGRSVHSLAPFFRIGLYTNHPFRVPDLTMYLGLLVSFDLNALAQ